MTVDRAHGQNLPFDPSTTAALLTAAQQMQGSSPFVAAVTDLQLPLIAPAALHRLAEAQATAPLGGRFVRWELCGAELRLRCSLDKLDTSLSLEAGLPSCRVGSVESIEAAQRPEFLAAVVAAFPLTDTSTFHCRLPDAEQVLLAAGAGAAAAAAAPVAAPTAALAKAASTPRLAMAARRQVIPAAAKAKSTAPCRYYSKGA